MRRAAAALALAALAAAGPAAAQTATTGTPQALFTRLIETDRQSASDVPTSSAATSSRWSRSWKLRWFPSPVSGSVNASRIARIALCVERW